VARSGDLQLPEFTQGGASPYSRFEEREKSRWQTSRRMPYPRFGSGAAATTNADAYSISGAHVWVRLEPYTLDPQLILNPAFLDVSLSESMTFSNKTMQSLGLDNYGT
jgi:hypothetical protein